MAVTITTVGLVFGVIIKLSPSDYIPFLATGIVFWTFISGTMTDGANSFIAAESLIKQLPIPKLAFVVRSVSKNVFTLAHNIILIPIAALIFGTSVNASIFLLPFGVAITTLTLGFGVIPIAIFATRYRDLPPIVTSLMGVAFYISPVLWMPESLGNGSAHFLLGLNPFYHLLQIMRLPALGKFPTLENWALSLVALALAALVAYWSFRKFSKKISYWV